MRTLVSRIAFHIKGGRTHLDLLVDVVGRAVVRDQPERLCFAAQRDAHPEVFAALQLP